MPNNIEPEVFAAPAVPEAPAAPEASETSATPQLLPDHMKTEAGITVSGLTKRFPGMSRPALDALSFSVYPGSITGLVGPDGAGKTTLIRLMIGLLRADGGTVAVAGFDAASHAAGIHAVSGYMPQKFGLYEDLSVSENLGLYADLRGITGAERRAAFERLLAFTGLASFQSRLAGKLSGGMKQKLGLACALLGNPQVLLLDEPSVGVDPISRRELWRMVEELTGSGMTVVWSTSYLDEAERCPNVILLNEGKMLYSGPPEHLLAGTRGRVWALCGVAGEKRRACLTGILEAGGVVDAVIQGRSIRVVLPAGAAVDAEGPLDYRAVCGAAAGAAAGGVEWQRAEPRFEDAFIDMLGGGPTGASVLGQAIGKKAGSDGPVIDARGLTKRFGDFTAVKDNTFAIGRGEIFGLLGPNGAGKSTTFKMMCGLLQPSEGTASIMGIDLKAASSAARQRIGYMAQKFSLYGAISAVQNLNFFAGVYGLKGRKKRERIDMMLSLFGLMPYAKENTESLPLGFKQRLALACAVMHEPDVLFLDEPTSGVDPVTRREFWLHINGMVRKGVTVMVTTHFMDEAEYCDRIALIYHGENIATGTPDDLKRLASETPGKPQAEVLDLSLEDAFIRLIEANDARKSAKGGEA